MFIKSICQIMASCFSTEFNEADETVRKMLEQATFKINKPIDKKIKKDDKDTTEEGADNDEQILDNLVKYRLI